MSTKERFLQIIGLLADKSKTKFAEKLEITPQQLSDYMSERIKIGVKMQEKLIRLGINPLYISAGFNPVFANNAEGRQLAAKFGEAVSSREFQSFATEAESVPYYPDWAVNIRTPAERVAKVIDLLGGLEKAAVILGAPREELVRVLSGEEPPFTIAAACCAVGFSKDWLDVSQSPYYDRSSDSGKVLQEAIETHTVKRWAEGLFRDRLLLQEAAGFVPPNTAGGRLEIARRILTDYYKLEDSTEAFAEFLTQRPQNKNNSVYTAKQVEGWEAGDSVEFAVVLLIASEGFDTNWLFTMQDNSIFQSSEAGIRLAGWYRSRINDIQDKINKSLRL